MKLKHFAGYGSVNAVKVGLEKYTNGYGEKMRLLTVKVTGNHEWGLVRDDSYDLFNWLVKRFDRSIKDYKQIERYDYINDYERVGNIDEEYCIYHFYIKAE